MVQIHSFICGYLVVPTSFVEEIIFSPLHYLGTLVKNQLTTYVRVFSQALSSIPLIYIFILMSVRTYFATVCSLVLSAEISVIPPNLFCKTQDPVIF